MKYVVNLALAGLLALAAGCATSSPHAGPGAGRSETCQVCRYHNDLACVCVNVNESTPRTEYQGRTYYFCSEDCQTTFAKNPGKYLPRDETKP